MEESLFVRKRSASWERLETLTARASRGTRRLGADELFELGRLYRSTTSDLAHARFAGLSPELCRYLNRLVARAHAEVYGPVVESGFARIRRFFSCTFPQEFRRSWRYVAICAALTLVFTLVSFVLVGRNPATAYALLPEWLVPASITKSLHDSNFAFGPNRSAMMSSLIITNNIRVAIAAFAAGITTLGTGTIYVIVFNALMLGTLGALYGRAGFGMDFWATIAPHGVIELTAIQIAGAAGLLIAAGVLLPGRRIRREAIAENSRRAGTLIGGVAAMLCVAGSIEGFFSPLRYSAGVRASVGAVTALLLIAYFSLAGRAHRPKS